MKKVVYVSGTRADYSLMRRALILLGQRTDLTIMATCMHLSPKFGMTVKEIEKDGFKIKKVSMPLGKDSLAAMAASLGGVIQGLAKAIDEISPDLIFVEADRGESLAGAVVGAHLNIPVVHHGGGDLSKSIDNKIRYAATMFSDYHLTGNEKSRRRLLDMGIPKGRIFNVGEPGLDDIHARDFTTKSELVKKYGIASGKPLIIFIQHPNTEEYGKTERNIKESLNAIENLHFQTVAVLANSDAGGRLINKTIGEYAKKSDFIKAYPNIGRKDFLGLMSISSMIVGNSTAGVVELPSFGKPFVCVGTRQKDRLKAANVIETDYEKDGIELGIKKALNDENFLKKIKAIKNPYGDGRSSLRIADIIMKILEGENENDQKR